MSKQVFAYIGFEMEQTDNSIVLSQRKYVGEINVQGLSPERKLNKDAALTKEEHSIYRKLVGQLNWVARHTRPDVMFDVMELSMSLNNPCVRDYGRLVKTTKKLKYSDIGILFQDLGDFNTCYFVVMSDAAFGNLCDSVSSSAGYIIFLVGNEQKSVPLCWKANKIQRKVNSPSAAEALALRSAVDHAILLRSLLKEMLYTEKEFQIEAWTDSNNVKKALESTTQVEDKRLRIDIAYLKDCIAVENISLNWCNGRDMLADCLTKSGCSSDSLLHVISSGSLKGHIVTQGKSN